MLSAVDLHLSFGPQTILDGVNLTIDTGTRAGLVGANGSGKTSLLRILAGRSRPDSGRVNLGRGLSLSYLPQQLEASLDTPIVSLADEGYAAEHALIKERERHADTLHADPTDEPSLRRLAEIDEALEHRGYYQCSGEVGRVLNGLGFRPQDFTRPLSEFSGGWRMRAALARTLLTRADFLLLDEPTNYLDSEARLWLSDFLRGYRGGVVLVSHDRAFLDDAIGVVLELFQGSLRRYKGTYSQYEAQREAELSRLVKAWEEQQQEIQRQEEFIRRFRAKATKARQVQSRVKALEKTEIIEIPPHLRPISITLPDPPHSGEIMVRLEELSRAYGSQKVLEGLDLTLRKGSRLAVVGLNGAGKSTLLRILAGRDAPSHGSVAHGTGVNVAYFAQDSAEHLPESDTVYEFLLSHATEEAIPRVRSILGAFLFDEDAIDKPLSVLSGGERSRLVMASLLVRPANLLILDEPTNHLDMTSQEVLARALSQYSGSVVVVSHDRYFLRSVTTDVLALWPHDVAPDRRPPRAWQYYPGSYTEFESSHLGGVFLAAEADPQRSTTVAVSGGVSTASPADAHRGSPNGRSGEDPPQATDYATQKAMRGEVRRLERREQELLTRTDELEAEHRAIQAAMAEEHNYTSAEAIRDLQTRLAANEAEHEQVMVEWEEVTARLEDLSGTT